MVQNLHVRVILFLDFGDRTSCAPDLGVCIDHAPQPDRSTLPRGIAHQGLNATGQGASQAHGDRVGRLAQGIRGGPLP